MNAHIFRHSQAFNGGQKRLAPAGVGVQKRQCRDFSDEHTIIFGFVQVTLFPLFTLFLLLPLYPLYLNVTIVMEDALLQLILYMICKSRVLSLISKATTSFGNEIRHRRREDVVKSTNAAQVSYQTEGGNANSNVPFLSKGLILIVIWYRHGKLSRSNYRYD